MKRCQRGHKLSHSDERLKCCSACISLGLETQLRGVRHDHAVVDEVQMHGGGLSVAHDIPLDGPEYAWQRAPLP